MNIESMISPSCSDDLGLEHDGLAALGDQLHLDVARLVQRHRLFAVVEVAVLHVRTCVREAWLHSPMLNAGSCARSS